MYFDSKLDRRLILGQERKNMLKNKVLYKIDFKAIWPNLDVFVPTA